VGPQYNKEKRDSIVKTFIEIEPPSDDDFLKIRETLTRIGIANKKNKTLTQSAHLLHKQGRYYITHFKQLFALDAASDDVLAGDDLDRLHSIAALLEKWNMCKIKSTRRELREGVNFTVIKHSEKHEWDISAKYTIGGDKVANI